MLPTRLLRSARPLSRLFSHHPAAPWRLTSLPIRLAQRLYSDSVASAPPTARHLPQDTSDSAKAQSPDEPKYSLTFTCKVPECDERTSHMFSKRAYHHGIVLIQCPKCKNRYAAHAKLTMALSAFLKQQLNSRLVVQASHCGQPWVVQGRTDGSGQSAEH